MVTAKQLSRKTDLGCLVLPAQLSHSAALSSAAAGSFWSDHVVALWQWDHCNSWRQMGVTQAMLMIYMLGHNPHYHLSCCSVTARSVLRLVFPLLTSAGKDRGRTVELAFRAKGILFPMLSFAELLCAHTKSQVIPVSPAFSSRRSTNNGCLKPEQEARLGGCCAAKGQGRCLPNLWAVRGCCNTTAVSESYILCPG